MVPAHGHQRYTFTPAPSGTRWYHTHTSAGRNLKKATYTGQFGFLYIEPNNDPGAYDQEVFLALREWEPFMTTGMDDEASSMRRTNIFRLTATRSGRANPSVSKRDSV